MRKSLLVIGLILITLLSCSESNDNPYEDLICDQISKVDNNWYKNIQLEGVLIKNVKLKGDCLEIEIQSGGCNGETWEVDLIDAGRVTESNPEQRDLKLSLINNEMCLALVTKTYTFDISPVRTRNNVVLLNLYLWDEPILYEY